MKQPSEIIWSITTRLIHWALAIIVLLNAFVLEEGDPIHRYLGYLAVALVFMRTIIGFKGREHERFTNFPISLKDLNFFLKTHFKRKHLYPGHNPAASIIYFAIWISILTLGISGWMLELDAFFGDETLEIIHKYNSNILLLLVGAHLIGIFLDSYLYRRKTWLGMIDGKKVNTKLTK